VKFYDHRALAERVAQWKSGGWSVLFTNGCFDPPRAKHVRFLELAKELRAQARLLVAVNGDDSVTRLKGLGRPIFSVCERMDILNGLRCVDWVTYFDEDEPTELVRLVRPNVIVKGGDYKPKQVAGHSLVDEVLIIPTEDAWTEVRGASDYSRPRSINELFADSVAAMVRGAESWRDVDKLYRRKLE
jgi:rfaE bifunctional protein nucleotidyltransferase chain/domain